MSISLTPIPPGTLNWDTTVNGYWSLIQSAINNNTPAGTVALFAGSSTPSGWLDCDGSAISRTTYSELFSAIGTVWGTGNGTTTFNLPDLRGRAAIGAGQGSGLSNRTLGQTGGAENHILSIGEMPSHTHDIWNDSRNDSAGPASQAMRNTNNAQGSTTSQSTGGDGAHNNMQPFGVLKMIIKS